MRRSDCGGASPDGDARPVRRRATDPSLADVDSLFARIRRSGRGDDRAAERVASGAWRPGEAPSSRRRSRAAADPGEAGRPRPVGAVDLTHPPEPEPEERRLRRARSTPGGRAEVVDPLLVSVAKRAKRAAQDDQNALLDAVRRHKGRPTAAQVLTPEPELLAAWDAVTREAIDDAYGAGRVAVGGEANGAGDELATEVAAAIVLPLRERIAAAIDSGEDGDTGGLVERIGARFREWKNQSLENALADALAMSWSRRVRRLARRNGAAVDPAGRGSLRRLRRQRSGADGQGLVVPDRPGAPARAPGLSVLAGSGRCSQPPGPPA